MKYLLLLVLLGAKLPVQEVEQIVETAPISKDLNLLEVKSFKGFTKDEIGRFWQYSAIVDNVTNSPCYKKYITDFPDLINNKDQTREELLDNLKREKPRLNFVMYYKNNSTVGYTYANSDTIWMNRKFHSRYSLAQSAANLAHERSHKLGFTHDFKKTTRRSRQAPYPIGAGIKTCYKNNDYDVAQAERMRVCYRSWRSLWLKKYCYWRVK